MSTNKKKSKSLDKTVSNTGSERILLIDEYLGEKSIDRNDQQSSLIRIKFYSTKGSEKAEFFEKYCDIKIDLNLCRGPVVVGPFPLKQIEEWIHEGHLSSQDEIQMPYQFWTGLRDLFPELNNFDEVEITHTATATSNSKTLTATWTSTKSKSEELQKTYNEFDSQGVGQTNVVSLDELKNREKNLLSSDTDPDLSVETPPLRNKVSQKRPWNFLKSKVLWLGAILFAFLFLVANIFYKDHLQVRELIEDKSALEAVESIANRPKYIDVIGGQKYLESLDSVEKSLILLEKKYAQSVFTLSDDEKKLLDVLSNAALAKKQWREQAINLQAAFDIASGQVEKAKNDLKNYYLINKESPLSILNLAICFYSMGDFKGGQTFLKNNSSFFSDESYKAYALMLLSLFALELNNHVEANDLLSEAQQQMPFHLLPALLKIKVAAQSKGQSENKVSDLYNELITKTLPSSFSFYKAPRALAYQYFVAEALEAVDVAARWAKSQGSFIQTKYLNLLSKNKLNISLSNLKVLDAYKEEDSIESSLLHTLAKVVNKKDLAQPVNGQFLNSYWLWVLQAESFRQKRKFNDAAILLKLAELKLPDNYLILHVEALLQRDLENYDQAKIIWQKMQSNLENSLHKVHLQKALF